MKNLKKSSKKDENFLQITIIISEYTVIHRHMAHLILMVNYKF